MKRYLIYRDSEIDWIGEIPEHWEVKRNKYIFKEINEHSETGLETLLMVSQRYGLVEREEFAERPTLFESLIGYKICQVNDLILNKLKAYLGVFFRASISGIVSPDYTVFRAIENIEVYYFEHLFKTPLYISELNRESKGIVIGFFRLYTPDFYNLFSVFPPFKEQKQIVNYIRYKSVEIGHFISNKQRLIELLKEQKTAIVNRAVTKGLNPHAPMKPSDIQWLAEIPAHWKILPLKHIAKIQTGVTLGKSYTDVTLETRPYLRVANVQDGYLDLSDIKNIELPKSEVNRYILKVNDVLMTEGGDFDKLGRGYVWEGQIQDCLHQNHIFAVRPDLSCLKSYFLAVLMKSSYGRNYFIFTSKQTTNLASTNSTTLKNLKIILPSVDEQTEILNFIEEESAKIDFAIAKIEKEIELIQEYRTTLISDAVTGKIDVRETSAV